MDETHPLAQQEATLVLRRSRYAHLIPLGDGRDLCLHAVTGQGIVLPEGVGAVVRHFDVARDRHQASLELLEQFSRTPDTVPDWIFKLARWIDQLLKRDILSTLSPEDELSSLSRRFGPTPGADSAQLLRRHRQQHWALPPRRLVDSPRPSSHDTTTGRRSYTVIAVGDCDMDIEAPFLRAEGFKRGLDFTVKATTPDDTRLLSEGPHDAVIVGALRARHAIAASNRAEPDGDPVKPLVEEARVMLARLRTATTAPILLDNLPVPTVQPLGLGVRGALGHRNRFRLANLALERVAEEFLDVYVVDIDATLAGAGKISLLDDWLHSFTHLGSAGWTLFGWPEPGKNPAYGIVPEIATLAAHVGEDPHAREALVATEHMDTLVAVLGIDRRKCVIVDLDGTLWPGVLAENGSPFSWTGPGPDALRAMYFGIQEALVSLIRRGIVIACVSKNDEATVRELWRYEDYHPRERLLTLDHFASIRINWNDKVDNILSIADELHIAREHLVFVDDNPVERERVRQFLPEVIVLGEDLFTVRRWLLSDPRLQPLTITTESAARTQLLKAQTQREHLRRATADEDAFRASLELAPTITRLRPGSANLQRVRELFDRTTQFNTTGRKFTAGELMSWLEQEDCHVFTLHLKDRFGDHGLVGSCVVRTGEIVALAISCRALGVGIEHRFMDWILADLSNHFERLTATIIATSRNIPVRNIYRDHGFELSADNCWQIELTRRVARA